MNTESTPFRYYFNDPNIEEEVALKKPINIKVSYNAETGGIMGYYPSDIEYSSIPEPFIEITEEEHKNSFGKKMHVINGEYVEYVTPYEQQLDRAKKDKIKQLKTMRERALYSKITISNGLIFSVDVDTVQSMLYQYDNWDRNMANLGLPPSDNIAWGSTGLVSKNDLKEALEAIAQRKYNIINVQYPDYLAQIQACTTIEDILDENGDLITQGVDSIKITFS